MLADIGNSTVNIMYINNRKPITTKSYTEKMGVNQCVKSASNAMMNKLGVTIDELIGGSRNTTDSEYLTQIGMQLEGCSDDEKRLICEMACAVRKTLKGNHLL